MKQINTCQFIKYMPRKYQLPRTMYLHFTSYLCRSEIKQQRLPTNDSRIPLLSVSENSRYLQPVKCQLLSPARLFVTPWTAAHQAPRSMGFSRQGNWSGLPFPSPGDPPNSGIEPRSPALQADFLSSFIVSICQSQSSNPTPPTLFFGIHIFVLCVSISAL